MIICILQTQIAEASSGQQAENGKEMENLVVSELVSENFLVQNWLIKI